MIQLIYKKALERKNIILFIFLFLFFMYIYAFLDYEGNTNYYFMTENFGIHITIIHITINIIIALLSSIMVLFSIINQRLTSKEPLGSNAIPFITFLFGLLTFGCTGCVVAFLTSIGIAFTPIILPNGNLLWKLAALLLVVIGFIFVMYQIKNTKCEVKYETK